MNHKPEDVTDINSKGDVAFLKELPEKTTAGHFQFERSARA